MVPAMELLSVSSPAITLIPPCSSPSLDRSCTSFSPLSIALSSRRGSCAASSSAGSSLSSDFLHRSSRRAISVTGRSRNAQARRTSSVVVCGIGDFLGADLMKFDLDKWYKDVEDYGSIAVYPPHEGGIEGRYATKLKTEGYHFLNMSARGMGDPEAYLTKVHGVRPAHLGKQAIECFYHPPELDFRLAALPEGSKGIVLWIIEAQVLSKTELQFLAILPALRDRVKVIAECGNWRSFRWKPLRVAAGLPLVEPGAAEEKPRSAPAKEAAKPAVEEGSKKATAAAAESK